MAIATSLWKTAVEDFRYRVASEEPAPAGVSVAALSAAFALALLEKALRIGVQRKDFRGDRSVLDGLALSAQAASARLASLADEDIAAYNEYLAARRLKDAPAMDAALHTAIEIPLNVARAAVAGLDLCAGAAAFVPRSMSADFSTTVILLSGAARATLFSVDSNLAQLPAGSQFHDAALAERRQLEAQTVQKTERLLTKSNAP